MHFRSFNRYKARYRLLHPLMLGVLVVTGCGEKSDRVHIHGRVTRSDGSPLVGAKVTFQPIAAGKFAFGFTDADGKYNLGTTGIGEGLPPGEYAVIVSEDRGTENNPLSPTIHRKYSNSRSSGLKFTVKAGANTEFNIVLDPP